MLRITFFIILVSAIVWTLLYATSGRNQRFTLQSIGKAMAVVALVLILLTILLYL